VPRRRAFGWIEDRFGKGEFEDNFTGVVGDFQNGIENAVRRPS
jgi:hypothetical protein